MKKCIQKILDEIDLGIDDIDLYSYDIIDVALSMVHRLQDIINDLRDKLQSYIFETKEDEIAFSNIKSRKFLAGCCFSTKYIG